MAGHEHQQVLRPKPWTPGGWVGAYQSSEKLLQASLHALPHKEEEPQLRIKESERNRRWPRRLFVRCDKLRPSPRELKEALSGRSLFSRTERTALLLYHFNGSYHRHSTSAPTITLLMMNSQLWPDEFVVRQDNNCSSSFCLQYSREWRTRATSGSAHRTETVMIFHLKLPQTLQNATCESSNL